VRLPPACRSFEDGAQSLTLPWRRRAGGRGRRQRAGALAARAPGRAARLHQRDAAGRAAQRRAGAPAPPRRAPRPSRPRRGAPRAAMRRWRARPWAPPARASGAHACLQGGWMPACGAPASPCRAGGPVRCSGGLRGFRPSGSRAAHACGRAGLTRARGACGRARGADPRGRRPARARRRRPTTATAACSC